VDGFVYVAVPALVALQVLPHAIEERSLLILGVVALGALIPTAFERASRLFAEHTDNLAIVAGISGLLIHTVLEGAALVPGAEPVDPAFGWAVVLHRIPVGLVVWWLVRPRHGIPLATLAVGSLVGATLTGALVGAEITGQARGPGFELFEAFVAGTLLHVVFHQGRHDHAHAHDHDHHHGHRH
jgi:zinc transporter ZupT